MPCTKQEYGNNPFFCVITRTQFVNIQHRRLYTYTVVKNYIVNTEVLGLCCYWHKANSSATFIILASTMIGHIPSTTVWDLYKLTYNE